MSRSTLTRHAAAGFGALLLALAVQLSGVGMSAAGSETVSSCAPRQSAYSNTILSTPGLIGYWRLGEPSGTTTACDSSASKYNGTYAGGVTLGIPGAIAEDPDTALALNGSTGQVSVPSASALNVGDSFTIEAWIKRGASKTYSNEVIASKQDGAWVLMFGESDRLTLRRSTVGNVSSATVATTDTTSWHYVAATKSGSSVHLYLDGVDVTGTVTNQTMANNSQPLAIGQSTGTAYLKGSIDEVALYNRPLEASQVAQHYKAGLSARRDPVLAAAGDIACPYGDTAHECQQAATASLTASWHPSAVAVLGDNQYQSGLLSEFDSPGAYNATWGQFNPIVRPAPGNHEYAASSTASGYFSYFGTAAAGAYYSYELGAWHIVSLNSNCSSSRCEDSVAGTSSSAELGWLEADLAAHPDQCVLAYWHHPAFSSGYVGNSPGVIPFWNVLYAAHADVVLNGHDHMYERFAQQSPTQTPTSQGIREFVVGSGGETLFNMGTVQPNMQAVDNRHFGVLFLTLHPTSYEWAFRATNGTLIDSGSTPCHAQPAAAASVLGASAHRVKQAPPIAPGPASLVPLVGQESAASAAAASLAGLASRTIPALRLAARPAGIVRLRQLARRGLPLRVQCSRACDLTIIVQSPAGGHERTIACLHETESEISRPYSTVVLRLSRRALRGLRPGDLLLKLQATDASAEHRTLNVSVAMH